MKHPAENQLTGAATGYRSIARTAWIAALVVILPAIFAAPLMASEFPTVQAMKSTVPQERSFDGIVEAEQRSTVSSQVSARIEELPFDVDDYVKRGDIIVRFRNQPAAAELKQAQAASKEASARLQEARANHARIQTLYEQKRVSKADMDKANADLTSAQARVDAAAGALSAAQERYENTIVRAPYSGIVVERHVELGEMATVGTPLMTGISLEHLRVVVDVPQSDIAALRRDAEAEVDLPTGESLETREVRIFPYADPSTHTFRVRLRLSEGQHGVYPGMWVKVKFRTGEQESLLVPESAVVQRSELTAVYVLDDQGTPRLRQVRLGRKLEDGNRVILAGLGAGETVVTDPEKARVALLGQQP
ncbi:MAG: efflux RND transporter periplasmic adaptor subunit [Lysobacterales bacterium]|jgi:RND family efflux transporter MFP subunit